MTCSYKYDDYVSPIMWKPTNGIPWLIISHWSAACFSTFIAVPTNTENSKFFLYLLKHIIVITHS